jgi:alcohol dehydrogenase class IV
MIAIPTTAGTGSEVTRNAVLGSTEHKVKASLRAATMLPTVALVDPELTYSVPPDVTATTGVDAFTQCLEPFVSVRANPLTDSLCREGMLRAARSLRRAYENGEDATAREDMAVASLFGGLALANAGLGAVHGFAGPIGGMFSAPHGAICARLLPWVMEANVRALQQRSPCAPALARYDEIGRLLTGNPAATAVDGVAWVQVLAESLQVRPLSHFGITPADFPEIVAKSQQASSMKANSIALTDPELTGILRQAN